MLERDASSLLALEAPPTELEVEGVDQQTVKTVLQAQAQSRMVRRCARKSPPAEDVPAGESVAQAEVGQMSASDIYATLAASLAAIPIDDAHRSERAASVVRDWQAAKESLHGGPATGWSYDGRTKGKGKGGYDPMA